MMEKNTTALILWSVSFFSGGLGILLGAFAAHGLKGKLDPYYLDIFEKANRYQFYMSFFLFFLGFLADKYPMLISKVQLSAFFIAGGMLVFSGSLYILALTQLKILGAITPIGGLMMVFGLFYFAFHLYTI